MADIVIQTENIGTALRFTVKDLDGATVDLSSADALQVILQKPDGTKLTKTASLYTDGTDGIIQYLTQAGDMDNDDAGTWRAQVFVSIGSAEWYSEVVKFKVKANL